MTMHEIFGKPISTFTRKQAIEDGVLVDLMNGKDADLVKQAGVKHPVAMTSSCYDKFVEPLDGSSLPFCQDRKGRLYDVAWMLRNGIRKSRQGQDMILFPISCVVKENGRWEKHPKEHQIKALVHGGDNMEPVITLMLPEED